MMRTSASISRRPMKRKVGVVAKVFIPSMQEGCGREADSQGSWVSQSTQHVRARFSGRHCLKILGEKQSRKTPKVSLWSPYAGEHTFMHICTHMYTHQHINCTHAKEEICLQDLSEQNCSNLSEKAKCGGPHIWSHHWRYRWLSVIVT